MHRAGALLSRTLEMSLILLGRGGGVDCLCSMGKDDWIKGRRWGLHSCVTFWFIIDYNKEMMKQRRSQSASQGKVSGNEVC